MKTYSIVLIRMFICLFLLQACVDESLINKKGDIKEGIPVTLALPFVTGNQEIIETKSGLADGSVFDLYVLVFDGSGGRVMPDDGKSYYTSDDLFGSSASGSITIRTTTGEKRIYAVANVKNDVNEDISSTLAAVRNESDLNDLFIKLNDKLVSFAGSSFPCSGFYTEGRNITTEPTAVTPVLIDIDGNGNGIIKSVTGDNIEGSIKLIRLFSTIKFNITKGGKVQSFVPTSWQVKRIPLYSNLYKQTSNYSSAVFDNSEVSQKFTNNNTFEFAMLENLQTGTKAVDHNSRENRKEAPADATYVVLKGHYIGKGEGYNDNNSSLTGEDVNVEADVTYYISLGKGADNQASDLNDYKSERNKSYTYIISVEGVDKIIAEVVEEDPYHRADGDVTYTEGDVEDIDAHYASKVYTFTRSDVSRGTEFQVKTPFSGGRYLKVSQIKSGESENENWNWVHFVLNATSANGQSYSNNARRYPGDGNSSLMSIEEFYDYLMDDKAVFLMDEIKVTCFIDEYYYSTKNWTEFVNTDPRILQIFCKTREGNGSSLTNAKYIISQKSIQTFYKLNKDITAWGIEWENETGAIHKNSYGNLTGQSETNGLKNMQVEVGNRTWYSDGQNGTSANYNEEFKKAYAACMSRNRDDDGDGMISKSEIKWYLPAIYQYMDIWMGTDGLPNGFPLYRLNGDKLHFFSNTSAKILWAEEGSSYGANITTYNPTTTREIRCVRNLGVTESDLLNAVEPHSYYNMPSNNEFDLSNMNESSLRSQFLTSELDVHNHQDKNSKNAPYKKFKVASKNVTSYSVFKYNKNYPSGGYRAEYWGNGYFVEGTMPSASGYWVKTGESKKWSGQNYYRWYNYSSKSTGTETISGDIDVLVLRNTIKDGKSPCASYKEDGDGWRLPNQRELQMMVRQKLASGRILSSTEFAYESGRFFLFDGTNMCLSGPEKVFKGNIRCVKDIK